MDDIFVSDFYSGSLGLGEGEVKVGDLIALLKKFGSPIPQNIEQAWIDLGLLDFYPERTITRLEAAVLIDRYINPFKLFDVNYNGNLR